MEDIITLAIPDQDITAKFLRDTIDVLMDVFAKKESIIRRNMDMDTDIINMDLSLIHI